MEYLATAVRANSNPRKDQSHIVQSLFLYDVHSVDVRIILLHWIEPYLTLISKT